MKYIPTLLAALVLLGLCACGQTVPQTPSAPVTAESTPLREDPATPPPAATLPPAETISAMASSIQADSEGVLWSIYRETEELRSVYDLLPEDIGHVARFCFSGDTLYTVAKADTYSLDSGTIYKTDLTTGETTSLADDLSPSCDFCILGNSTILYAGDTGLKTVSLTTGEITPVLEGRAQLLAAGDGYAYYTKSDSNLWRSDSNFAQEELLVEGLSSSWVGLGENTLCTLVYNAEGTIAAIEFRSLDGTLQTRQPLDEILPAGFYAREGTLYVPQPEAKAFLLYDIATAQLTGTLSLDRALTNCQILFADEEAIYFLALEDGTSRLYRLTADGSGTSLLLDFSQ